MTLLREKEELKNLLDENSRLKDEIVRLYTQKLELEQKLAAKSWLKRFMAWLDRNFN